MSLKNQVLPFVLVVFFLIAMGASAQTKTTKTESSTIIEFIELKKAALSDALRLLAEVSGANLVATADASEKTIDVYLRNLPLEHAVRSICRASGLWYEVDAHTQSYLIMTLAEYKAENVVFRDEAVEVFTIDHPRPDLIAQVVGGIYRNQAIVNLVQSQEIPGQNANQVGDTRNNRGGNNNGGGQIGNGGAFGQGPVPTNINNNNGDQAIADRNLSPDQIERLERQLGTRQGVDPQTAIQQLASEASGRRPPIYVSVLVEQNLVVVRTRDHQAMTHIRRLMEDLDRPIAQVQLEMKILKVELGEGFQSFFDFNYNSGGVPQNDGEHVLGIGRPPGAEFGKFLYRFLSDDISAKLELLERENRLEQVASPLILGSNNRISRFSVGGEHPFLRDFVVDQVQIGGGSDNPLLQTILAPTYQFEDIGDRLEVLPQISSDGQVTLDLLYETSAVVRNGATILIEGVPRAVDTRSRELLRTSVVAKDGFTIMLGGIVRTEITRRETKVPILGDIPLLGYLFREEEDVKNKSELIILITPRIIQHGLDNEAWSLDRASKLSRNPWLRERDKALEKYFGTNLEDPEPAKKPKAAPAKSGPDSK